MYTNEEGNLSWLKNGIYSNMNKKHTYIKKNSLPNRILVQKECMTIVNCVGQDLVNILRIFSLDTMSRRVKVGSAPTVIVNMHRCSSGQLPVSMRSNIPFGVQWKYVIFLSSELVINYFLHK